MTTWLTLKQVGGSTSSRGEKPADKFVRIARQLAYSFLIDVNVGPNPMEDEQLEFSAFLKT